MDGNRRTAFTTARYFLVANGYGYLTSETDSDHTLARYLNHVVEGSSGTPADPTKFEKLFTRRLRNRKAPRPIDD